MPMTKQDFIALADAIKNHNKHNGDRDPFTIRQMHSIADFCELQNSNFKRDRWVGYIFGENGPNGGGR